MPKYVLIETEQFEIADHPEFSGDFHQARLFGDSFEMPEPVASRAISEGAAILPEDIFAALGFTDAEIEKYPNRRTQQSAPADWQAKHKAARVALHNVREELKATAPKTVAESAA
jgi:hypothetical protein